MLERCPRCGSMWVTATAMNGGPSEFWKECSNPSCNTYLNTYVPQAHQYAFHIDSHTLLVILVVTALERLLHRGKRYISTFLLLLQETRL